MRAVSQWWLPPSRMRVHSLRPAESFSLLGRATDRAMGLDKRRPTPIALNVAPAGTSSDVAQASTQGDHSDRDQVQHQLKKSTFEVDADVRPKCDKRRTSATSFMSKGLVPSNSSGGEVRSGRLFAALRPHPVTKAMLADRALFESAERVMARVASDRTATVTAQAALVSRYQRQAEARACRPSHTLRSAEWLSAGGLDSSRRTRS